jgi:hypothetical protein
MKKRILFDVGANDGSRWFYELIKDQENTYVFMFEPTPYLCNIIKEKYKNLKNWFLINKAASNYNGKTTFNIAGHHDWGCSSLLEFRDDVDKTWYPHDPSHFKFNDGVPFSHSDNDVKQNIFPPILNTKVSSSNGKCSVTPFLD